MKRVGVLTGGGDAPGLNAAIKGVVLKGREYGYETIGIKKGWAGLLNKETGALRDDEVQDIQALGGTILGTSRTNPYKIEDGIRKIRENFEELMLDALIAMGGEDTLSVAYKLNRDENIPIVGVAKTIDNDLSCTDCTIGSYTAVDIATSAIDKLHTTACSHSRVMVVEVMGRHAGWMTLHAGLAGGAHFILIPEVPFDLHLLYERIKERHKRKNYTIIAVAEGAMPIGGGEVLQTEERDAFGHVRLGGIGKSLEKLIQKHTGIETRSVVLGHLQRGGTPAPSDRILGLRLGVKAMELVKEERFGQMATYYKGEIDSVNLKDAVSELKTIPEGLSKLIQIFEG
ncbi:MAG: ATP-dependent 6-phosphofructokinase [bacterium]|nr:ATP-dependent 6-phosphofructokinase [bacterium]